MSASDTAREHIFSLVSSYIADPAEGTAVAAAARVSLYPAVISDLDSVLAHSSISYRDGVVIQLSYGIADPDADLTRRQVGSRTLAQQLGSFFADRHIRHVKDAYQNIAKNTDALARGNVTAFDALLHWANSASPEEREQALKYACATIAATARPVFPMPALNRSMLTFARCARLVRQLLEIPSAGAYQQFIIAALLNTLVADTAGGAYRVETKSLNASDRSSYAAGDVQIATGNRVIEAFEVTANDWRSKLGSVSKTVRDNDLSRIHIVASRPEVQRSEVEDALESISEDVSVLDVNQVAELLLAVLTRAQRAEAFARIYEYLDRYQPNIERVNTYVQRLDQAGLVENSSN